MQSLEAACEEGEQPIKKIKLNQTSLLLPRPQQDNSSSFLENTSASTSEKRFCIHTKLRELYIAESAKNSETSNEGLKCNSHLLEKLVKQERLNHLVVNLYPGNKGYSLALPSKPRSEMDETEEAEGNYMLETQRWPYEENELLNYINNEELPAFFIDLLEPDFSYLFYSGCIIAEIRDYRQAYPNFKCDIRHVLFKPTLQSILADINLIMEQHADWGSEEKQLLESQILLATNPELCLEPDPIVGTIASNTNHCRQLLNTHTLRRTARKFSQDTVNKKRKLDQFTHRPGLELFNYMTRLRAKTKTVSKPFPKRMQDIKPTIPVPNLDVPFATAPTQGVHINEFKAYQRPKETSDCSPQLIEEYVLETDMPSKEKGKSRVYHIKLSILQRPSNSEYLGELYLDRDHKKDERNGVACRFSLGSRAHANRYIQQFTEIFTEGGRKSVRVKYGLSPGLKERVALVQAQAAQMQAAQQAAQMNLAQQHLSQLNQSLQNSTISTPLVNGTVTSGITLVQQQNPGVHNTTNISLLSSQIKAGQSNKQLSKEELEINALATNLMNSAQQYQATANAKQKLSMAGCSGIGSSSNAAITNLLNSSPVSNVNSDASAAVVNAINNVPILPQQVQVINQKLIGRKMTLSSLPNARLLNHTNLITLNNSRMNLTELNATIPSTSGAISFTSGQSVPIKQVVCQEKPSPFSALLVGTPAADRPDIVNPNSSNSLLLEKLASLNKSPKANPVISRTLSSPPPSSPSQASAPTINVQSLNLASLQNLSGLQNVQVQLPVFVSSAAAGIQGHPTSILVSLPVATTGSNVATSSMAPQQGGANLGTPTVVFTNAGTAQLVTSNIKSINQSNIRNISQSTSQFQYPTSSQRSKSMQNISTQQQNTAVAVARSFQKAPFTIKMTSSNTTQETLTSSTSQQLQMALHKQAQIQQLQQQIYGQSQNATGNMPGKVRRRSNTSTDSQQ